MAFNNIMQLATASIVEHLHPDPTVVEWGNQRFRYTEEWTSKCSEVAGKPVRKPVEFVYRSTNWHGKLGILRTKEST